jgi:hypothetical protein
MGLKESLLARSFPTQGEDPAECFREFCSTQWMLMEKPSKTLQYNEVTSLLSTVFDYVAPLVGRVR